MTVLAFERTASPNTFRRNGEEVVVQSALSWPPIQQDDQADALSYVMRNFHADVARAADVGKFVLVKKRAPGRTVGPLSVDYSRGSLDSGYVDGC